MTVKWKRERPDLQVKAGERVLAWATTLDAVTVGGTRDAVYVPQRVPWEEIEAVHWDADTSTLRLSEVGTWGEQRPEHALVIHDAPRFLSLVRERVTASVVHQRHVPLGRGLAMRVIARRAPGGPGHVHWIFEYDDGVDPTDPTVRLAAAEALTAAKNDLGDVGVAHDAAQ